MQCLQASQFSNNLSVLERQRACLNTVNNNGDFSFIDQSFSQWPETMLMPFGVSENVGYGSVIDDDYLSNGWPDFASIQYPALNDEVAVREDRSLDMSCNGLKKRKPESCPNSKKESSCNGSEDSGKKKLKEEAMKNKQLSSKREVSGDSTKENSKGTTKGDFIHVRARRGQATDSHSLAERVRRERISERMKYLQELVPGCNKITGKAGMLDEIINYVQSLQRQVEFLSMKLTALSPGVEFIPENFLNAESIPVTDMSLEQLESSFPHFNSLQQGNSGLDVAINAREIASQKALGAFLPAPQTFLESYLNVQGSTWDTSLQNLYGEELSCGKLPIQPFQGIYFPSNVKMEEM